MVQPFQKPEAPGLHRLWLEGRALVRLPLLVAQGSEPGPTLLVSAGVHGDEYEGVRAVYETAEAIDTTQLRGTFVAVPVMNWAAHREWTRHHPEDGENLARMFPGRPEGSISERIAWQFSNSLLAIADFYIDLHSGGIRFAMPSMAGYYARDPRSRAAAEAFGAPVIWGHPIVEPGRTISSALARGVPFLYTEAQGAGRIRADDLVMMRRGLVNVMRHLGMVDGALEIPTPPRRLHGIGNTDLGVQASEDGFWMPEVELLSRVVQGQRLGRIVDPLGVVVETLLAPSDGVIGLRRELPPVSAGDTLILIAEEESE